MNREQQPEDPIHTESGDNPAASISDRDQRRLIDYARPQAIKHLIQMNATRSDAEDAVQEALTIYAKRASEGQFDHRDAGAFLAFIRITAIRIWQRRAKKAAQTCALEYRDPQTGT